MAGDGREWARLKMLGSLIAVQGFITLATVAGMKSSNGIENKFAYDTDGKISIDIALEFQWPFV